MLEKIILVVFWVSFAIQFGYLFLVYIKAFLYKPNTSVNAFNEPVSVIICARNEEENLLKNLPLILEQHYHQFEVVVVNDRSWDSTHELLEKWEEQYAHLKVVNIQENDHNTFAGKKLAKMLGIKATKYEHLLFTDADCVPSSDNWLYEMCKEFANNDLIIGLSPFKGKKGFWAFIAQYDSLLIGYNYFSYALANIPYMAVGRNMAYKKQLFFDVKGFKSHYFLPSGDDDLFVRDVLGKAKIGVSASEDGLTFSYPKTSFTSWIRQKKRHFLTAPQYNLFNKITLGVNSVSYLLLLLSFFMLLFFGWSNWYILSALLVRICIFTLFGYKIFKTAGEVKKLLLLPLMELVLFVTNASIFYSNVFSKPTKWS
jgi:glycosyltransferase involved in cell wall biosynthesis